ncbi:MAG TPA: tetratricopeptide repeat protein [Armatimonadota bacterium]|nr:tetratricopeptide repeat protein [Armatimonadota bacterium]
MRRWPCVSVSPIGRRHFRAFLATIVLVFPALPTAAAPAHEADATATAVLDQLVGTLWEHSDDFFHNGDYETTTRVNRLALRLDPQFVDCLATTAWLLRAGLNRPQEALALYHRGMRDNPDNYECYSELGSFYFDQKQYPQAARYLREAVRRNPPAPVFHQLAHAYEKMNKTDEALAVWRAALEKFPADVIAQRQLQRFEAQSK